MEPIDPKIQSLLDQWPFLSYGSMSEQYYLGIVQNSDSQLISMYLLDMMPDKKIREGFLDKGLMWWWESNRQLPINIFIGQEFKVFRPYLKHFPRKDFQLLYGPAVSLQETISRRVRKRQVTLVRRTD